MFHYVTFFTVALEAEEAFVREMRMGGGWLARARHVAPDLVAAVLLRHQNRAMFLCHDIWSTPEAYSSACRSEAVRQLMNARKQMAADHFELGAFSFPKLKDEADVDRGLAQIEPASPARWLSTEQLEEELCGAVVQATIDNPDATTHALDQVDAYFAKDGDDPEKQHRQSLLRLLTLLRPNLAELLGEPSTQP